MTALFKKLSAAFLFSLILSVLYNDTALAQQVNDIVDNIESSTEELPGLVSAFSYLLAIMFGVLGILKIKDHVENPTQTPLRVGVIRLLIGGAFFALPIVYEAARETIGTDPFNVTSTAAIQAIYELFGTASGIPIIGTLTNDFNTILESILDSISDTPAVITGTAYLLGLIIAFQGLLKIKDHVENPEQTALRESVVRLLTAGALFALPTIYNSMYTTIENSGGPTAFVSNLLGASSFVVSGYSTSDCTTGLGAGVATLLAALGVGTAGPGVGELMCSFIGHTAAFPAFLTAIAYLIGLVLGLWGILKIRDHVLNPQQTTIWEGVSRLLAGGMFFALPFIIEVSRATLIGGGAGGVGAAFASFLSLSDSVTGYHTNGCTGAGGLDQALICFMGDIMGPLHIVLNFFAFCAGVILLMIGISRLIKSAQDGARGPGGIGTLMTLLTGGALISYNEIVRAFSTTLAGDTRTKTFATLQYSPCVGGGTACAEAVTAHSTISAILQFVIVVGLISFVRGIFIIRNVAEGNQQASIMAGMTHIIGGALAVNLGPLLNAVQTTLGIVGFGIAFT